MSAPDRLYRGRRPHVADFVFDERVAAIFPDMIRRSVPGYDALTALLGTLAAHLRPRANIYDLGCSLGDTMRALHPHLDPAAHLIGIDNSPAMLGECRTRLHRELPADRFHLELGDIREVEVGGAAMVILNFTLQFIPRRDRLPLLRRLHAGLQPGGALILSEKVCAATAEEESLHQALHAQFKAANGYTELEIAQKRMALERVLQPDRAATHLSRLRRAGFSLSTQWFQGFNFRSFVALK